METIGIVKVQTGVGSGGVGFLVIPDDKNRAQYIEDCYRTQTVTINGGEGYGFFNSVRCPQNILENLQFPTQTSRGTPVVWVKDGMSHLPVIVNWLRPEGDLYSLGENQWRITKGDDTRNIEIFADGNTSTLQINVLGDGDEPSFMDIKLTSGGANSIFNLYSDGEVLVNAAKKIALSGNGEIDLNIKEKGEIIGQIRYSAGDGLKILTEKNIACSIRNDDKEEIALIAYESEKGFSYKDEFENEIHCVDGEMKFVSDKINHNDGSEPMVLGETLENLLDDLLTAIQEMTMISPVGATSPPVNIADFAAIQAKIGNIKSKKSNLE